MRGRRGETYETAGQVHASVTGLDAGEPCWLAKAEEALFGGHDDGILCDVFPLARS